MSKIRCKNCGYTMDSTESRCSSCGYVNDELENTKDNNRKDLSNKIKNIKTAFRVIVTIILIILPTVLIITGTGVYLYDTVISITEYDYYTDGEDGIYFLALGDSHESEWWKFDISANKWNLYCNLSKGETPDKLGRQRKKFEYCGDLADELGIDIGTLDIHNSRNYIDVHRVTPRDGYYIVNDEIYYYLDDNYSDYGNKDVGGWYKYLTDDTSWKYYCQREDKEMLGDELWYYYEDYEHRNMAGISIYKFENTDYYKEAEAHYNKFWNKYKKKD